MKKKKIPINLYTPTINEINFKYQKVVSFSQFQIYQQCPHKWANQYVRKLYKTPPSIHMVFGTAIHNTLQHYLTEMYKSSAANADRIDLEGYFQEQMSNEYSEQHKAYGSHFSSAVEMSEFFGDGIAILKWFKSHRRQYFTTKGNWLIGCEVPLQKEVKNNVIFNGFVDLIIYDELLDKLTIYDIKTSTKGWNDWDKKNETKISQILLYKQFFSELYQFPIDKIEVEFIIAKRKVEANEFVEFPKRLQTFKPAAGKQKINSALQLFNNFINEAFDTNGQHIEKEYNKNISKLCEYCPFFNTENCISPNN